MKLSAQWRILLLMDGSSLIIGRKTKYENANCWAGDNCDGGDLQFSSSCFYFPSEKRVQLAAEREDGKEMLSLRRERKV